MLLLSDSRRGDLLLPRKSHSTREYKAIAKMDSRLERKGRGLRQTEGENERERKCEKGKTRNSENEGLGRVVARWCDMMRGWHCGAILSVLVLLAEPGHKEQGDCY